MIQRGRFCCVVAILLLITCVHAYAESGASIDVDFGFRVDEFSFRREGNGADIDPSVAKELIWEDLQIPEVKLDARYFTDNDICLRGSAGFGLIMEGTSRGLEFDTGTYSSDDGYIWAASLGLGYRILAFQKPVEVTIIPMAGYAYHNQYLYATRATGLDSRYETAWRGPWFGLDASGKLTEKIALFGTFEYHLWTDYEAEGNWNLSDVPDSPDFAHPVSVRHDADGSGIIASCGINYALRSDVSIGLVMEYQKWTAESGIAQGITAASNFTSHGSRLNEVDWESYGLMLRVTLSRLDLRYP